MDNEESEEGEEAQSRDPTEMDVDNTPHIEEIPPGPSSYEVPMQNPPPYWNSLMKNIGRMNAIIECMEQCQERYDQYFD